MPSYYEILENVNFAVEDGDAVFEAAVAAALEDEESQGYHHAIHPIDNDWAGDFPCPNGHVPPKAAELVAQGYKLYPVSQTYKDRAARMAVIGALNAHNDMLHADSVCEAYGG